MKLIIFLWTRGPIFSSRMCTFEVFGLMSHPRQSSVLLYLQHRYVNVFAKNSSSICLSKQKE
ncbi:hypothetical protein IFM89_000618 [Coptis chinensis]|uniref:Uncharacterized protein n=1 Tax=Coptis chinensis TaxID=261450 RepID=A0A835HAP1_9MAGN|nr:hypothetical protein IFM89_000618 [Coptis chinensis]